MTKKWDTRCVRSGEEQNLLDQGYEPYGVSGHDTSYMFLNTSNGKRETEHRTTDYIHLRKLV